MSLPLPEIAAQLIDALEAFDAQADPVGLYAAEEFQMTDQPFPRWHQDRYARWFHVRVCAWIAKEEL